MSANEIVSFLFCPPESWFAK